MSKHETMTVGDWFVTMLLLSIPLVNVVFFLIWLFGGGNRNRVNFCRASFLWAVLGLLLYAVLIALGVGTVSGYFQEV